MRKRHVMVTMASPSFVLQGMAPEPNDLFEDAPTSSGPPDSLPASLQHTNGCRSVESHAATTGNHMFAWFDDDEAMFRWYASERARFAQASADRSD